MSEYYVYEYIRLDYNEPFYIGKGSNNRWKIMTRGENHYFNNICKNIPVAVNILHSNLDEKTALEYECWYIWQLRDIQGYNLVNMTDGGEGIAGYRFSDESKNILSIKGSGKNNSMYKQNSWKNFEGEDKVDRINRYLSTMNSKTKEEKNIINAKKSRPGKLNGRAKKCKIVLDNKELLFNCRRDAIDYLVKNNLNAGLKPRSLEYHLNKTNKNNLLNNRLYFEWVDKESENIGKSPKTC